MQEKTYQSYTTDDFLQDPAFIRFVKDRKEEDLQFWEAFEKSEVNANAYVAAKKQLEYIYTARRVTMPENFSTDVFAMINRSIDQHQQKKSGLRKLYRYVGSAAALLALTLFALWLNSANITISTTYGEIKDITLPDGSVVTLNANSSIKYPMLWRINNRRNVRLKGEAYFKVVHTNKDPKNIAEKDRFQVFTERLHIQVLGTEFDVKDRNQMAKIVLTRGSINVLSLVSGKHYILKPKQMALETKEEPLKIVQTDPEAERAWVEGNMKMQKTTVSEVAQEFENIYGKRIVMSNPEMSAVKIDGMISFKSEESVLFVLANILNAKIKRDSNTVTLEAKK